MKKNEFVKHETVLEEQRVIQEGRELELKFKELQLNAEQDFFSFRKQWSQILLYLVIFIVIFQSVFLLAVGLKWLVFSDEWLVRIIITGTFAEVLGLAKIVVDFLFKQRSSK